VSEGLCGATRPGHFDGVATVVTKLLLQSDADWSFFGEKDYQQFQVVRRLATDLDLKTEIVGCPTMREADGLAMSSRNLRLDSNNRKIAPVVFQVLQGATNVIAHGGDVAQALQMAREALTIAGIDQIDYLELRCDPDLHVVEHLDGPARLFVAVWLNGVRLIDNLPVKPPGFAQSAPRKSVEPV
jgi:pantoate--beta-alanine ligase